jgi:hypothetical protein
VPAGAGSAVRVNDTERQHRQRRIGGEPLGHVPAKRRWLGIPAIVVEEQHDVAGASRHRGVASAGHASVLREPERGHVARHLGRVGAVSHDDHLGTCRPEWPRALDRSSNLIGPVAHGQDHDRQLQRNRLDAMMATRCATTIMAATTRQARSKRRVAVRPPRAVSMIAAASTSTDNSTACVIL